MTASAAAEVVVGAGSLRNQCVAGGSSPEEGYVIVGFRLAGPKKVKLKPEEGKEEPWLLTARQCAARLSISRSKFYQLLADGDGPRSITIGRSRRFRNSDLLSWMDERVSA